MEDFERLSLTQFGPLVKEQFLLTMLFSNNIQINLLPLFSEKQYIIKNTYTKKKMVVLSHPAFKLI